jgi:hypothetical protein
MRSGSRKRGLLRDAVKQVKQHRQFMHQSTLQVAAQLNESENNIIMIGSSVAAEVEVGTEIVDEVDLEAGVIVQHQQQQPQEDEERETKSSSSPKSPQRKSPPKSPQQQQQLQLQSQRREPDGMSPQITGEEPWGIVLTKRDVLDRVFDSVESAVCRGQEAVNARPTAIEPCNSIVVVDEEAPSPPAHLGSPESAEEKRQEHEERAFFPSPPAAAIPLRSILKKKELAVDAEEKLESDILENPTSPTPVRNNRTVGVPPPPPPPPPPKKEDLLGFIVESLLCREKPPALIMSPTTNEEQQPDNNDLAKDGDDNNSIGTSSPMRLHKLATPRGDALPSCWDWSGGGDPSLLDTATTTTNQARLQSSSLKDPREAAVRLCRSTSLLDLAAAESGKDSFQRLEDLRQKKRQIEAVVQSSSTDPGRLIPRGYKEKPIPSSVKLAQLESSALASAERSKFQKAILLGSVISLVAVALILIGVSFFWPTNKL